MKLAGKLIAHAIFVCGLAIFYMLPLNKYSWMQEMDSSISTLPVDNSSGSRLIFATLVLAAIVLAQLVVLITSSQKRERLISAALIAVALAAWSIKYL